MAEFNIAEMGVDSGDIAIRAWYGAVDFGSSTILDLDLKFT